MITLKRDAPALVILNNLYKRTAAADERSRSTRWRWSTACRARSTSREALFAYIEHQVEVITRRVRVPAAARRRTGPTSSKASSRPSTSSTRSSPRSGPSADKDAAREALHGRAVRVLRGAGRVHPRHAAPPPHPPGSGPARGGDGEAPGHHRRARSDPRRRTVLDQVIKDELGEVREKYASRPQVQDHLRPGRHRHRGPHRRRGPRRHDVGQGLHQDRRRSTRSRARVAAAAAWPAPSSRTRTTSPTSSPPRRTPTCCSSRTSGRVYRLKAHEIPMKERTARGTAIVNLLPLQPGETDPDDHRHARLRDQPVPVLRHQQRPGQEDQVQRVRLVAARRPHRHQPARRRRAGEGHPDQRRRRHLHGQPRRA